MRNDTVDTRRSDTGVVKAWMTLAGAVLLLVGLFGFINNPIVGPQANALLPTDAIHNIVHVITGLVALYIAFVLRGENQANGAIGFGVLYVVIFLAVVVSPNLFGLFQVPANVVLHLIHAALAVVSLGVGYMARGRSTAAAY